MICFMVGLMMRITVSLTLERFGWYGTPTVKVVVIAKSMQMITCQDLLPKTNVWMFISMVYASNDDNCRKDLWKEMEDMASDQRIVNQPWMLMGNFNQVLNPYEHSTNTNLNVNRRIMEFRNCLLVAEVFDMVYKGNIFTWWNKSKTLPVAKKLDRILVNESWCVQFPSAYGFFGHPDFSDHAVCEVILDPLATRAKKTFQILQLPNAEQRLSQHD